MNKYVLLSIIIFIIVIVVYSLFEIQNPSSDLHIRIAQIIYLFDIISSLIDESGIVSSISLFLSDIVHFPNYLIISLQPAPGNIPQNIADANNEFTIDFYKQISDSDENLFFSPLSMYTAFSLLYEGARENTADEIQQVFGFESNDASRYNDTTQLLSAINYDDSYSTLELSNGLWIADWFTANDDYIKIARETYLSDVEQINFIADGVSKINGWAADKTNGKIDKVVSQKLMTDLTTAIIANAIYFKGTWLTEFSTSDTKKSEFKINNTNNVDADFMNIKAEFKYASLNGAQILEMPYKGDRLSMLVILPKDANGIKQLEESISVEQIKQWKDNLALQEVIVSMPKFETRTHYNLTRLLTELGMPTVFDNLNANLLDIGSADRGNLYVKSATQDAYVKVNEEGTEAAAVTTIVIFSESSPPQFIADHPFIFIIQDDSSGAILFMGRVFNPAL